MTAPTDYAGLTGWWDASQESLANNDPVVSFLDRSGASRHLGNTAGGLQPLFKTGIFPLGGAGVDFDGSDDSLASAGGDPLSDFIANTAYSAFIVVIIDAIATTSANTYENSAVWGDVGGYAGLTFHNTGPKAQAYNYDGTDDKAEKAITTGTAHVIHTRHESGNIYISVDGGAETSAASGNTQVVTGQFLLGRGPTAYSNFFDGKVGEFFTYNVARSSGEIAALISYLSTKWISAGSVTGTVAQTLAGATSAAAGTVGDTGTLAKTLANLTSAASGASGAAGTLAVTLANATVAASGSEVTGTLARTLAGLACAASGTFTPATVTGTSAVTLANTTSAAAGTVGDTGSLASTLANLTSAAAGATVTGTLVKTLANATVVASGTFFAATVAGTLAKTLDNTTSAATGATGASGTLANTLANTTSTAAGSGASGTLARTLANATVAAAGTHIAPVTGTLARTLGGVTLSAAGNVPGVVDGSLASTLANLTSAAAGATIAPITGTLAKTLGAITPSAFTAVPLAVDPSPVRCTARNQKFSRKFRYHRTACRPALAVQVFDRRGQLLDLSDPSYSFLFRIGDPGDTALLSKTTNINGSVGSTGTPNLTILWEPDELDIAPGRYDCQLIATSANNDLVIRGTVQILDTIR